MAVLDLYIYCGDEQVTGGADATKPRVGYPSVLGGQSTGFAMMMDEIARVVPSGPDGRTGGTYDPYWDGRTFTTTASGTPTTTVISFNAVGGSPAPPAFAVNELVGREVEFTTGPAAGQKRRITANTPTQVTVTPALSAAPASGNTLVIKGGFVKFFHAPTTSVSGVPIIADQPTANGDCWFGLDGLTPTAIWMSRLEQRYKSVPGGFRFLKNAFPAGIACWLRQPASPAPPTGILEPQLQLAIAQEAIAGNTMRVRAVCIDAGTRDLFAANLFYESDAQRTIDSIRDMVDALDLCEPADVFSATSSTTTTLTVPTASWTVDQWKGRTIRIDAGVQAGQLRVCASNTATTITLLDTTATGQNYGPLSSPPGAVQFSILFPTLVVISSPKVGCASSVAPVLAPGMRQTNRVLIQRNQALRTWDWEVGEFATQGDLLPPIAADRYYDTPSYLLAGFGWDSVVQSYYTLQPTAPAGAAIPTVVLIGNSQVVTSAVQGSLVSLLLSSSLSSAGSTIVPGVWIWDDLQERVVPYDPLTNGSTMGTVAAFFGPELTLSRDLVRTKYPNGVLLFKNGKVGAAMTSDAGATLVAGHHEPGGELWNRMVEQWIKCKQAVVRDINRSADVVLAYVDHCENDLQNQANFLAWQTKAPQFAQSIRDAFSTRVSGQPFGVLWMQPPKPSVDDEGGSTYQPPEIRRLARDAVAALPSRIPRCVVIPNAGSHVYGLQRVDNVHYDAEAVMNIGRKAAELALPLLSDEGEAPTEEPEVAAFVVESGGGLPDANAYCTVDFADDYVQMFATAASAAVWGAETAEEKRSAIRKATRYLDIVYAAEFVGYKRTQSQALQWPRSGAVANGFYLSDASIPLNLQQACVEFAMASAGGDPLLPNSSTSSSSGGSIIKQTLTSPAGSESIEYAQGTTGNATGTRYPAAEALLASLLDATVGSYSLWRS